MNTTLKSRSLFHFYTELGGVLYRTILLPKNKKDEKSKEVYRMISFITPVPLCNTYKGFSTDEKEKRARERLSDEEFLRIFNNLFPKGFVDENLEYRGQFNVLVNSEGDLLFDKIYDIKGRPYPKTAEEFKRRLKGEF